MRRVYRPYRRHDGKWRIGYSVDGGEIIDICGAEDPGVAFDQARLMNAMERDRPAY